MIICVTQLACHFGLDGFIQGISLRIFILGTLWIESGEVVNMDVASLHHENNQHKEFAEQVKMPVLKLLK